MAKKPHKARQYTAKDAKEALAKIPDDTPVFGFWDEGASYHEARVETRPFYSSSLPEIRKLFQVKRKIGKRTELAWRDKDFLIDSEIPTGKTVVALIL